MFALQCLLLLAGWIGYGVLQWRRSSQIQQKVFSMPRTRKVWLAILALFGSAAGLLTALVLLQMNGGMADGHLHWWAFAVIALVGLAFVHAQTMAAAMMVSLIQDSVTMSDRATSTKVEQDVTRD